MCVTTDLYVSSSLMSPLSTALTCKDWKDLAAETNKSAMPDHVAKQNHVIDWSGAKVLDTESHQRTRQL